MVTGNFWDIAIQASEARGRPGGSALARDSVGRIAGREPISTAPWHLCPILIQDEAAPFDRGRNREEKAISGVGVAVAGCGVDRVLLPLLAV